MKTGEKILATYNKIPSTEIWNVENINTTLRQIEYYKETNVFESEDDILKIYDCLEKSIDYVEMQAKPVIRLIIREEVHNRELRSIYT